MKVSKSLSFSAAAFAATVFWSFAVYGAPAAPPVAQATACPATATVPAAAATTQIVVATQVPDPAVPETAPPTQAPPGADSAFQVRFSSKLATGDSFVDLPPPAPAPATPKAANLTTTPTVDCANAANTIPAATATASTGTMAPIADDVTTAPMPPAKLKCKVGKVPTQVTRRSGKAVWRCTKQTTAAQGGNANAAVAPVGTQPGRNVVIKNSQANDNAVSPQETAQPAAAPTPASTSPAATQAQETARVDAERKRIEEENARIEKENAEIQALEAERRKLEEELKELPGG